MTDHTINRLRGVGLLVGLLIGLSGCQLNPLERLSWETNVTAPIAFAEVGLLDILTDSSTFSTTQDGVTRVVFRDTVASFDIEELIVFPDTLSNYNISLDTLTLNSDTISQRITLREIAEQLVEDPATATIGQLLLANDGGNLVLFPGFQGLGSGPIDVDATDFFEFAELEAGELVVTIDNRLPLGLSNVIFNLSNRNLLGDPLVVDTFQNIPANDSETRSYDLAGKEVESELRGELTNLDVDPGFNVPINLEDFIEIRLVAQNLKARTATAVFPRQVIVDTLQTQSYLAGGDAEVIEITKIKIKSGQIKAEATSTVEDTIFFQYQLPGAQDASGQVPEVSIKLLPAPANGFSQQSETFDLGGFVLDLTGDGTGFNAYQERVFVELLPSGRKVTLEKTDSVTVDFSLANIEATYVEGYIGQASFSFSGVEALDFFEELNLDRIRLTQASAGIIFESSIGIEALLEVNTLHGRNKNTGEFGNLAGSSLVGGPLLISGLSLPDTNGRVSTALTFGPDNSNVNSFVSMLPNEVVYDFGVDINPNGRPGIRDNFITSESQIEVLLDVEVPLVGALENLVLTDTVSVDFEGIDPASLEGGGLRLILENGFPVEVLTSATILEANQSSIQTVVADVLIDAAEVDGNGIVTSPAQTVIEINADEINLDQLVKDGRFMGLSFQVSTKPFAQDLALYSTYTIKAKLVGSGQFDISAGE